MSSSVMWWKAVQDSGANIQQSARHTAEVNSNIASIAQTAGQTAGQTGAAASGVLDAAGSPVRETVKLRSEVEDFLSTVRAA